MNALGIIKSLPIAEEIKTKIINQYDSFTVSQKTAIDQLAWTTYDALYEERLKENLQIQYDNVKAGLGIVGEDFYKKALKKTDQEMTEDFEESVSKHDLSEARKAMEVIVREIQASKKLRKHLK
jgi:hypothetical protein